MMMMMMMIETDNTRANIQYETNDEESERG
jgi:hypothetical protein